MPPDAHELLRENYGRLARDLLAPILDLMTEAHHAFEGDAEKFHILLLLALRMAEHPDSAAFDLPAVEAGRSEALPALSTNVKSIAASTGIPEETVRRKVRAMVREGWIARHGNALTYTARAAAEFSAVRNRILRAALANHRTVERLLAARA
jgi:hypothetical protein